MWQRWLTPFTDHSLVVVKGLAQLNEIMSCARQGHAKWMGHSEEFSMADYAGFLCVYAPHSYDSDSMVIASFTD